MLRCLTPIPSLLILLDRMSNYIGFMKEMLYEVRDLKSSENMIIALTGQYKQLSHEPEKFR